MLLFTVIGAFSDVWNGSSGLLAALRLAVSPLLVSIPLVLGASIIVGLPLTALLKHKGWESASAYISVGAIAGFALPIVILILMAADAGYAVAVLGAFGGAITGRTWWAYRRKPRASYTD